MNIRMVQAMVGLLCNNPAALMNFMPTHTPRKIKDPTTEESKTRMAAAEAKRQRKAAKRASLSQ